MPKTRRIHQNIIEPFTEIPIESLVSQMPPELRQPMQDFAAAIQKRLRDLGTHHAASAGLRGPVGIAEQGKDAEGNAQPALVVHNQMRIESATNPTAGDPVSEDDDQAVLTLGGLKRYLTCPRIEAIRATCAETPDQTAAAPAPPPATGIVHQFWGYTYEPTVRTSGGNNIISDPGILEQGKGVYFAMPIPCETIVDTVTYSLEGVADPFSPQIGPASAAIYQMDQVAGQYNLLGFATSTANTGNTGFFSMPLSTRLILTPGEYAIGWFSFCALYLCVAIAIDAAALANKNPTVPRFGVVTLDGIGINASWPAVISSNNAVATGAAIGVDPVMPILFFEDSQGLG